MEQGGDDHAVLGEGGHELVCDHVVVLDLWVSGFVLPVRLFHQQPPQGVQHVEAVLQETALAAEVVLRAGRGRVEVAVADVLQELVHAGALHLGQLRFKPGDIRFSVHDVVSSLLSRACLLGHHLGLHPVQLAAHPIDRHRPPAVQ